MVLLLRPTSSPRLIQPHLPQVELRLGSITEPASLPSALAGVTHIIHCAGCTKAARVGDFYEVNQAGTRNLVEAANAQGRIERFVHLSSLAAVGPALPARPAREADLPHPVSEYGRSKLGGESEVCERSQGDYVIVRPPAVYGPRDAEFLRLFQAVQGHIAPKPGRQPLSLVYVRDLAAAVTVCLEHPAAARKTYFIASREVVTARQMAAEIVAQMKVWTIPLPLPTPLFWPLCLAQELRTRLTGKANVLSLQKYAELRAPGWVCDPGLAFQEMGCECRTGLAAGILETLTWYRENHWL